MKRAVFTRHNVTRLAAVITTLILSAPAANAAPPSNDAFAQRKVISSAPFTDQASTAEATLEAGEPQSACGFNTVGATVWYEYTPALGGPLQIETLGSDFDTVVSVWTGSGLANLTEVACNDDASGKTQSIAAFSASAGTPYLIQVGGRDARRGTLALGLGSPTFGSIAGTVASDVKDALGRACVDVVDASTNAPAASTHSVASGAYTATGLKSGSYKVNFYDCHGKHDHLGEWYADQANRSDATSIAVASPSTTSSIDAVLTATRLSVVRAGKGTGAVLSDGPGIDCGTDCEEIVEVGKSVTLRATVGANSVFAGWSGCSVGAANECTATMNGPRAVTATFGLVQRTLTVARTGAGAGTISATGINCGPGTATDCQQDFDHGTSVTLTASPDSNSTLSGWTGCDTVTAGDCTVKMDAARDVSAAFGLVGRRLTVTRAGSGSGSVTSTGIDCGAASDCQQDFDHGTSVTLTATPDAKSVFGGWTGCDSETANQCTVAMTGDRSVVATFDPDTVAPDTVITSSPAALTKSTSAEFAFSATKVGSTFECSLDGAAFSACTSPKAFTSLSEGSHTFRVRAVDSLGNVDPSPAQRTWTIDVTPPESSLTAGPSGRTKATQATFAFVSTETSSTFTCSLDGAAPSACTSPKAYADLSEGSHTFSVWATDAAGNVQKAPTQRTWIIDVTPPDTSLTAGPSGVVLSPQATFEFTADESPVTFECALDGGDTPVFTSCKSPKTYPGLEDGDHTFRVRAIDAAGNVDATEAVRTWTVDFNGPETTLTSGPSGITTSHEASFTFTASESPATFECSLDEQQFAACSSPKSFPGFGDGTHTFRVRAIDAAGNRDTTPAERTWTVDAQGPLLSMRRPTGGLFVNDRAVGTGPVSVVAGFVNVEVRAVDLESGVSSLSFEVNGTAVDPAKVTSTGDVFKFEFRPTAPGWHTITTRATNGSGVPSALHVEVFGVPA